MYSFDDRFIEGMDVGDWCSNMFLMLASDIIIVEVGLDEALSIILFSFLICFLTQDKQEWKKKWSGNKSVSQLPGLNSSLKKENEGKNSFCLSSTLMSEDFKWSLCLAIRWLMDVLWHFHFCDLLELRMLLMMWLDGRDDCHSRNLLYNFLRYRCIEMSPEMALTPRVGDIWNMPEIQRTARHDSMSPYPTIYTLCNTRVHVGSSDCSDILSHIKVLIDKAFSLTSTLNIPDINPNNRYV